MADSRDRISNYKRLMETRISRSGTRKVVRKEDWKLMKQQRNSEDTISSPRNWSIIVILQREELIDEGILDWSLEF